MSLLDDLNSIVERRRRDEITDAEATDLMRDAEQKFRAAQAAPDPAAEQSPREVVVQLWPWKYVHVESSGLRARRVGVIDGFAYAWRIYFEGALWRVVRTPVVSVDLWSVSRGRDFLVGTRRTRSDAVGLAEEDVRMFGQQAAEASAR